MQEKAQKQWTRDVEVDAKRGSIYDRNMYVLAQSAAAYTVAIQPEAIAKAGNADQVAEELSRILDMPREDVYAKATNTEKKEIWLKRQITTEQSEEIENLKLKGVSLIDDVKRFYLNKDFASQVIGYTTQDGVGQTGIEKRYNSILEGRQGRQVTETAKDGSGVPNGQEMIIDPQDGQSVVLTIDEMAQSILEDYCNALYTDHAPNSVQGLVMDVTTGEILAMANIPQFDLNDPPRDDASALAALSVNTITATPYEPGSIFGIFTTAAALNESATGEYTCNGSDVIDGEKISCSAVHGTQNMLQAVQNHCSIAAAQQANALGKDTFYQYLKAFGFGEKTGIDFATDTLGDVMEKKYARQADVALMGAGENMKVSQIQMADALSSLLNGGTLYTPRLVLGLADGNGNIVEQYDAEVKGQTVTADVASQLKTMMLDYIQSGDGGEAQIAGYSVGGISGSSMLYDGDVPVQDKVVSSFFAFAPADSPRYLVMVTANGISAGDNDETVCAPYAKKVLEDILKNNNIAPDDEAARSAQKVAVPNVVGMDMQTAKDTLANAGLSVKLDGSGSVLSQIPASDEEVYAGSTVTLNMETKSEATPNAEMVTVPDFTGMNINEARDAAIGAGLKFVALGDGRAQSQKPIAGLQVEKGATVTVEFKLQIDTAQ
ncbi:stage V sporulation protein D [Christensenellaceae bacterium]|nr:stage V sporulation protein D [Christensenellaceae bacterium]BDF61191.1 stage V sporulation protein D [Christensenellaceae bacterium]